MATRKPECTTYEEKVEVVWSEAGKQFDLLKTIVAFANCEGGELCIVAFKGDEQRLDSARLDDFVSKYVSPPVRGIVSAKAQDGSWTISVYKSPTAPHVIKEGGNYVKKGVQTPAFYRGQVYVRHSSKSEPASAEDLQRLIREGVASWLASLGEAVARVGISDDGTDTGIPFRLVAGGPALEVSFRDCTAPGS
jgi:predicted HTH transcriptional regulator